MYIQYVCPVYVKFSIKLSFSLSECYIMYNYVIFLHLHMYRCTHGVMGKFQHCLNTLLSIIHLVKVPPTYGLQLGMMNFGENVLML